MKDLRPLVSLCLAMTLAATASAQNWFDTGSLPTEPGEGETWAVGDFDGDGDEDLWFVEGSTITWTGHRVLLGDGAGSFTPGPVASLPAGGGYLPLASELTDLTGDGFADVCSLRLPSAGGYALVVTPGGPGGAFGAPLTFPVPAAVEALAFGDNDGDGVTELATLYDAAPLIGADSEVRWWDWNGTTLVPSAPVVLPAAGFGDGGASGMASLDWDGDGLDDLVVGESLGSDLLVLTTVAGAPMLAGPMVLSSGSHLQPIPGDLDGDGDEDVLCVSTQAPMHTIPLLQVAPGSFVVGPISELPFSTTAIGKPRWLADWDGDGDLDLVSSRRSTSVEVAVVSLFENDAQSFALAAELQGGPAVGSYGDGGGPADFDGDGRADFAACNAVLFGSGRLEDGPAPLLGTGEEVMPAAAYDRDGDGDLDLALRSVGGSVFTGTGLRANDGTGQVTSGAVPAPPSPATWGVLAALGDFDGQGGTDYLVTTNLAPSPFHPPQFHEQRIWFDDHLGGLVDGGVAAASQIGAGADDLLSVADVDGDGDLDVIDADGSAAVYWANDGTGSFTSQPLFAAAPVAVFDLENDGDLDYLGHTAGPWQLVLLRDDGAGFTTVVVATTATGGVDPDAVHLVDLDQDGLEDLVVGGVYQAPNQLVQLWRNTGVDFALTSSHVIEGSCDEEVAWFDVDGDGVQDLTLARGSDAYESDRVLVLRGLGGGFAYEPFRRFLGMRLAGFADLDGDGDPDGIGGRRLAFRRFDGPDDGTLRQFGQGTAGTAGVAPLLGASGPLRPGSATADLRLRQGLGGSVAFLLVGGSEAALADFAGLGLTLYAGPPLSIVALPLTGTPGAPGMGTFDLALTGLLPGLAGGVVYTQFGVLDPGAPFGLSTSNGLELVFGL